jgi:hypothetical protein
MSVVLLGGTLLVVTLGLLIAYQGYRAYQRHQSRPMLFTSLGFLFISLGSAIDCSLLSQLNLNAPFSGLIQTCVLTTGMLFVLHSIYR